MLRALLGFSSAALALTLLARPAAAQPAGKKPMFETTKVGGTDGVYVFRYGNRQSMFVVTSAGVIATDPAGYGVPEHVPTYIAEVIVAISLLSMLVATAFARYRLLWR